nr:hypothetical protein [Actinomycetota bacterium]
MTPASVAGATTARADGPLKLAVPRGALFDSTLAMLDRAGLDTDGLRSDSRSMIFDGSGVTLVTMRP